MEEKIKLLASELGEDRLKMNVPLSDYIYSKTSVISAGVYVATNSRELIRAVELCRELDVNFILIGSGSKLVPPRHSFPGLAIKNRADKLKIFGIKGKVSRDGLGIEEAFVEAESGTSLKGLSEYALKQKLGGLDVLSTELGTIGGSFLTNRFIREKAYQAKILTGSGFIKLKQPLEVNGGDVIIAVTFKLRSKTAA